MTLSRCVPKATSLTFKHFLLLTSKKLSRHKLLQDLIVKDIRSLISKYSRIYSYQLHINALLSTLALLLQERQPPTSSLTLKYNFIILPQKPPPNLTSMADHDYQFSLFQATCFNEPQVWILDIDQEIIVWSSKDSRIKHPIFPQAHLYQNLPLLPTLSRL